MKIDTSKFRAKYSIDNDGRFGHYKNGECAVCGHSTTQCDATMLWYGVPIYLCSEECHTKYWKEG